MNLNKQAVGGWVATTHFGMHGNRLHLDRKAMGRGLGAMYVVLAFTPNTHLLCIGQRISRRSTKPSSTVLV